MGSHHRGDLVLGQAIAESSYCFLSGRLFSLEKEIKEKGQLGKN